MRSLAEIMRRFAAKGSVDDEVKDMAAASVFMLREIDAGINTSAEAWEKRDYWLKADRFRIEWEWVSQAADDIEDVLLNEAWDLLPRLFMDILPHLGGIKIKKFTRKPDLWNGAYAQFLAQAEQN